MFLHDNRNFQNFWVLAGVFLTSKTWITGGPSRPWPRPHCVRSFTWGPSSPLITETRAQQ